MVALLWVIVFVAVTVMAVIFNPFLHAAEDRLERRDRRR